ncbi:hypothetical protein QBC36DRAFT_336802 [Triangularia setosa]|uniref:Uncharacterized protein n=1 Tax=Triangularia setosa TaxID=2587417 RepID=A0AAN6W038_9PEZI|nr:hypothetical protein QBC36DRAFT_336802 [Podospora setosa]
MRDIKCFEAKLDGLTKYMAAGVEWRLLSCEDRVGNKWAEQANPWLILAQEREKTVWQRFYQKFTGRVYIGELTLLLSVIPELTSHLESLI